MKHPGIIIFSTLIFLSVFLQERSANAQRNLLPHIDSVDMLITSMGVQLECTEGIDNLYNFKFSTAEDQFMWLRGHYPKHPLPYFLMGLSHWWKMVPNIEMGIEKYDKRFLSYMDSAIYFAEEIYDEDEDNVEAAFFLAAAYSFKGRLYSERKNWTKATFSGKRALKYHEIASGKGELSPELLFGDGLYNYYSVWIPENYSMLKAVLIFFKKGDKKKGIEQLEKVVKEAFYTKVEAQYFLMRIYEDEADLLREDKKYKEANQMMEKAQYLAQYLHTTYPDNAYFHRYYARVLYQRSEVDVLEKVALDLIQKIEAKMPGYEETSGRYAGFYLGHIYKRYFKDYENARKYLKMAVKYSRAIDETEAGYFLYSLSYLGQIAEEEKKVSEAKKWYKQVVEYAERKHPTYKPAKKYLKKH